MVIGESDISAGYKIWEALFMSFPFHFSFDFFDRDQTSTLIVPSLTDCRGKCSSGSIARILLRMMLDGIIVLSWTNIRI